MYTTGNLLIFNIRTVQIYLFAFPITKLKKKKTLFTINKKKKKKKKKRPLRNYPRSKLLRGNEWIFSNICNYRYSSSRFISMHLSTTTPPHSPPPTPRSYLSSNDQFQTGETFLNAYWRRLIVGGDLKSSTDASAEKFVAGRERYPGIQNGRLVVFHPCSTDVTTKQAYPIRRIDPWKEKCNKVCDTVKIFRYPLCISRNLVSELRCMNSMIFILLISFVFRKNSLQSRLRSIFIIIMIDQLNSN